MKKDPVLKEIEEWTGRRTPMVEQWWGGLIATFLMAASIMAVFWGCAASGGELTLVWDMPPAEEHVTLWRVFKGIDEVATTSVPKVTLQAPDDAASVFSVRPQNASGIGPPASITVIPLVIQGSHDLKAWADMKVIYDELQQRKFFRIKIITP